MGAAAYTSAPATAWPDIEGRTLPWTHAKIAALAFAVVLALGFRITALSTYGLSEDELHKIHAIDQYRAGHFGANAEHPMLMKLAMWVSVDLARGWDRIAPADLVMSLETALRLPNALAGTATTLVLFGIADLLFGSLVAVAVSVIWAFDVNAIAINRIGKEDTFLLLFFLLAVFCYERAKRFGTTDWATAQTWYALSGASFGLMLASKYMPHYLGIYALFNTLTDPRPGRNKPLRLRYYGSMLAVFVIANVAVLMPDTWRYCVSYVQGATLVHHGFLYAGRLYVTNIPISPLGVPATYYFRLLGTKVPLVLLAAAFELSHLLLLPSVPPSVPETVLPHATKRPTRTMPNDLIFHLRRCSVSAALGCLFRACRCERSAPASSRRRLGCPRTRARARRWDRRIARSRRARMRRGSLAPSVRCGASLRRRRPMSRWARSRASRRRRARSRRRARA